MSESANQIPTNDKFLKLYTEWSTILAENLTGPCPDLISPTMFDSLLGAGQEVKKINCPKLIKHMKEIPKGTVSITPTKIALCKDKLSSIDIEVMLVMVSIIAAYNQQDNPSMGNLYIGAVMIYTSGGVSEWKSLLEGMNYEVILLDKDGYFKLLMKTMDIIGCTSAFKAMVKEHKSVLQKIARAFFAVNLCLLGKQLTTANVVTWGENCCKAFLSSTGVTPETDLTAVRPTLESANSFRNNINTNCRLRSGITLRIIADAENENAPSWFKQLNNALLGRLQYAELIGFKLIDTYLMTGRIYMMLWGEISQRIPALKDAYDRFLEFDRYAPYLKLLSEANMNPQFNSADIKYLATIAKYIGMKMGNTKLENINVGSDNILDPKIKTKIDELLAEGSNAIFTWTASRQNNILIPQLNSSFVQCMTNSSGVPHRSSGSSSRAIIE